MIVSALMFVLACAIRLLLPALTINRQSYELESSAYVDPQLEGEEEEEDEHQSADKSKLKRTKTTQSIRHRPTDSLTLEQQQTKYRKAQMLVLWIEFKQRSCHALLILLSIFYLRFTTILFNGFSCELQPDPTAPADSEATTTQSLYLYADGQTLCWHGSHITTVSLALILLLVYSVGFPLFCFILLTRAFTDNRTGGFIGWLRSHFKCLRGKNRRRAFSLARGKMVKGPLIGHSTNAAPAVAPLQPSTYGGWVSDPANLSSPTAQVDIVKQETVEIGTKDALIGTMEKPIPAALPLVTTEELAYEAKVQQRRENMVSPHLFRQRSSRSIRQYLRYIELTSMLCV
jgi:hypothetical protein